MTATMSRDRSLVHRWLAGPVGMLVGVGLVAGGLAGCSPAPAPVVVVKPAAAHADHDAHDHGKHDDHDHGEREGHDDHDHDDHGHAHPETLAAGVAELEAMWGHVKGALKAGDRDEADEKVHAVGHLLEDFEGLLAKETAGVQEAGKKATAEVFECFDALDTAFHGDEGDLKKLDLDALGGRLEAAIKTLKELAKGGAK
jgi:inorganic pyrophosphatase